MTLISAVLGTSSESARDTNTLALLDYGFANFQQRDARSSPARCSRVRRFATSQARTRR